MATPPLDLAFEKLQEADFFLGLLNIASSTHKGLQTPTVIAITAGGGGVTLHEDRFPLESQISYLLSAFANGCYSALEIVRRDKDLVSYSKQFCSNHPLFYASGPKGGIRTVNTHFRTIKVNSAADINRESQDPLDELDTFFDEEFVESSIIETESIPYPFRLRYYISKNDPQDSIDLVCSSHLMDLNNFLCECRRKKSS